MENLGKFRYHSEIWECFCWEVDYGQPFCYSIQRDLRFCLVVSGMEKVEFTSILG